MVEEARVQRHCSCSSSSCSRLNREGGEEERLQARPGRGRAGRPSWTFTPPMPFTDAPPPLTHHPATHMPTCSACSLPACRPACRATPALRPDHPPPRPAPPPLQPPWWYAGHGARLT